MGAKIIMEGVTEHVAVLLHFGLNTVCIRNIYSDKRTVSLQNIILQV
jgi:hypothetical protein